MMENQTEIAATYRLFKRQKNLFVDRLIAAYPDTRMLLNWNEVSLKKTGNWFIMFAPASWGAFKHGFSGVHYTLAYHRAKKTGDQYVRLSVGVEKPLKEEFKAQFKKDVIAATGEKCLDLFGFDLCPHAGIRKGAKLLETRVPLNEYSSRDLVERFQRLSDFNLLVADIVRHYDDEGRFLEHLTFNAQPGGAPDRR
jgi:hypothetical protein